MFFLSFSLAAAHNTPPSHQNIVVNGGFESANDYCSRHLQMDHFCEVASLDNWNFGSAMLGKSVMEVITNYQDSRAAQGSWSLDLNSNDAIQVEQILNTEPGQFYSLDFKLKPNTWCDKYTANMGGQKAVTVSIGDKTKTFTTDGSAWKTVGFKFEASSQESKLSFKSDTRGWCGPMIDDVQVVPVGSTLSLHSHRPAHRALAGSFRSSRPQPNWLRVLESTRSRHKLLSKSHSKPLEFNTAKSHRKVYP